MTVAALYVDPAGVYAGLEGVEVWDEARDARLYAGPWPVVAHPPCQRWSVLAPLIESLNAEHKGVSYCVGRDAGCFVAALAAVRWYGGVLEHPAQSLAWRRYRLPVPSTHGWAQSFDDPGYATEVSQAAYGHPCRKRTWLYYVGADPPPMRWNEPAVNGFVSNFRKPAGRDGFTRGMSSPTPPAFRDVLLGMARSARVEAVA